jgi:hypothetical protein
MALQMPAAFASFGLCCLDEDWILHTLEATITLAFAGDELTVCLLWRTGATRLCHCVIQFVH